MKAVWVVTAVVDDHEEYPRNVAFRATRAEAVALALELARQQGEFAGWVDEWSTYDPEPDWDAPRDDAGFRAHLAWRDRRTDALAARAARLQDRVKRERWMAIGDLRPEVYDVELVLADPSASSQ